MAAADLVVGRSSRSVLVARSEDSGDSFVFVRTLCSPFSAVTSGGIPLSTWTAGVSRPGVTADPSYDSPRALFALARGFFFNKLFNFLHLILVAEDCRAGRCLWRV